MKTESLVRQNLHGRKAVCLTGQGIRCGKTKLRLTGLLADNACLEALADFTSREVKALSPAVLIKVGDERVKLVDEVWGAEDPIADTLAVLLIEELIVGVYAGVDEVLSHRAGLPGENIERVLSEPGVFHGEI